MAGRPTNEPANYFALGKQTDKDTEGTTFYFLKHLDGTGLELEKTIESEYEGGDGQEVGLRYQSALAMDGALVVNARPEVAARLFAYTLGADSVSAPNAGASGTANTHTAVPTSSIPYLTVEQRWADQIERQAAANITRLSVEGEAGRPLKLNADLVGGGTAYRRDTASALTPTRETVQPFFYPGGSYVIDGTGDTTITKFRAEVTRNVDADIRTVALTREDVIPMTFDTNLEFTLKYEDKTLYDKVQYLSGSQLSTDSLGLATGTFSAFTTFGSGTAERYFRLEFPLITYTAARVNKLAPDGQTMYIDVVAQGIKARSSATHSIYTVVQTASAAAF